MEARGLQNPRVRGHCSSVWSPQVQQNLNVRVKFTAPLCHGQKVFTDTKVEHH